MRNLAVVAIVVLAVSCDPAEDLPEGTGTPPSTTPPPVEVPDVTGRRSVVALASLARYGLTTSIQKRFSGKPEGLVLRQTPKAGRAVAEGTLVELIVAQPFPRALVPEVTTKHVRQAERILTNAGFEVDVRLKKSLTRPPGDVVSQIPQGGRQVRADRVVRLVVIRSGCTPGYSPCIQLGKTDVDCAGSGDGPRYVGTVRVTGLDPFGLDPDDDGFGCE